MNVSNRTLFIADNLDVMRGINSECIDLIYLDPPFNTKKQYKAPIGTPAEGASFKDIWTDEDIKAEWHGEIAERNEELYQVIQSAAQIYDQSMKIYLMAMGVRLFEMHRILKPTGSIYLHCDPTASHYVKIVMDSLFGKEHFRNEIVWGYPASPSATKRDFPRKHDILLRYTKSNDYTFNADDVRVPYSDSSMERIRYAANASTVMNGTQIRLNNEGKIPPTVWTDIQQAYRYRKEYTRYPTQKPLKLLRRIIKVSSNQGDTVLDPFCGCATACVASEQLGRQWIGIDISPKAGELVQRRLKKDLDYQDERLTDLLGKVSIENTPPVRTDPLDTATRQQRLPSAHTHKHELYGEQEGLCNGCRILFPFRNMTIDHIVPQSAGGTDLKENLQLLCNACNSTKGTRSQAEFIKRLKQQGVIQA